MKIPLKPSRLGFDSRFGYVVARCPTPHLGEALHALREKPGHSRLEAERILTGRSHPEEFEHARLSETLPEEIAFAVIHHHQPSQR